MDHVLPGARLSVVAVHRTTGEVRDGKVLSTPQQEDGVLPAIESVGLARDAVQELVHGYTVGINASLSRTGSRCGPVTW